MEEGRYFDNSTKRELNELRSGRAGYFRPTYYQVLRAALDANNNPISWHHSIAGQSIVAGTPLEPMVVKDGIDGTSLEGAGNSPYAFTNLRVDLHSTQIGVAVQWWRSVGSTHNAFSTETFMEEIAAAAGKDPVEFRRGLPARLRYVRHRTEGAGCEEDNEGRRSSQVALFPSTYASTEDIRSDPLISVNCPTYFGAANLWRVPRIRRGYHSV